MLSMQELEKLATDISNNYGEMEFKILKAIIEILSQYKTFDQANNALRKMALKGKAEILAPAMKLTSEMIDEKTAVVVSEVFKRTNISFADIPALERLKTRAVIDITNSLSNAYNTTFRNAQKSAFKISTYKEINQGIKREINQLVKQGVVVSKQGKTIELFAETTKISLSHYQKTNLLTLQAISEQTGRPPLIIISQHSNASEDHARYQGQVFINDVGVETNGI